MGILRHTKCQNSAFSKARAYQAYSPLYRLLALTEESRVFRSLRVSSTMTKPTHQTRSATWTSTRIYVTTGTAPPNNPRKLHERLCCSHTARLPCTTNHHVSVPLFCASLSLLFASRSALCTRSHSLPKPRWGPTPLANCNDSTQPDCTPKSIVLTNT
jgi:hypothetical protein